MRIARPLAAAAALTLAMCSSGRPPLLGDDDAGPRDSGAARDALTSRPPIDAGRDATPEEDGDAGTALVADYEGACPAGRGLVWRYHDFQTKTPGDSSIEFHARTASTLAMLGAAPKVPLATVTGPDITVWTGVDLEPKLTAAQQSPKLGYLRVVAVLRKATDGTAPTLVARRQLFDCVVNQ